MRRFQGSVEPFWVGRGFPLAFNCGFCCGGSAHKRGVKNSNSRFLSTIQRDENEVVDPHLLKPFLKPHLWQCCFRVTTSRLIFTLLSWRACSKNRLAGAHTRFSYQLGKPFLPKAWGNLDFGSIHTSISPMPHRLNQQGTSLLRQLETSHTDTCRRNDKEKPYKDWARLCGLFQKVDWQQLERIVLPAVLAWYLRASSNT